MFLVGRNFFHAVEVLFCVYLILRQASIENTGPKSVLFLLSVKPEQRKALACSPQTPEI